jgi:hypothetical protein
MSISNILKEKFEKIIEINSVPWNVIDEIACSDPNILRPIKGVCFETLFKKIIRDNFQIKELKSGKGDSDVDIYLNSFRLQLKTIDKGSTIKNVSVGVALHKTHGNERRPYNLYSKSGKTFDFLIVFHPTNGILIVPYENIPENNNWDGYLGDPVTFKWNSKWLNRWDLLILPKDSRGKLLDHRIPIFNSDLPNLSKITFLEDFEIIETLCEKEYFRAAVMGLKGNIKDEWFYNFLKHKGFKVSRPDGSYSKYDILLKSNTKEILIQVKGTSKNMCNSATGSIGVEVMGTHGQFPRRGYKKSHFDYLAVIISEKQIVHPINKDGLHFIIIPMEDLPLHYLIGKGDNNKVDGFRNNKWNLEEYNNVIYPNIKLKVSYSNNRLEYLPDINKYSNYKGFNIIPNNSNFRKVGPYLLDDIPFSKS